jgi:hypothetical protein
MSRYGLVSTWVYYVLTPVFALIMIACYYPFCLFVVKYLPVLNGNWEKDPIRAKKSEALLSDKQ